MAPRRYPKLPWVVPCLAAASFALGAPSALGAQTTTPPDSADKAKVTRLTPITVTATRSETDVFRVPKPVSVLDRATLTESAPNTVSDLFRTVPGLDVTGVGVNQVRPSIRGQRGQRILLLQDGLRLNNTRRQQDFGEIPGLVDVGNVERVEVVRGPASVLYGTDAIGGVVNIISRAPTEYGFHGSVGYRYSSPDGQHKATGSVSGRWDRFAFTATGSFRDADPYSAPAGSFGDITLADKTPVFDTGVRDASANVYGSFDLSDGHSLYARVEHYDADTAGFGYVDPAAYAPDQPSIEIRYPYQRFSRVEFGYRGRNLHFPLADRLDVSAYVQDNERQLDLNVFVGFGPTAPAGAGVDVSNANVTDLRTIGFRVESQKFVGAGHRLTYGVDFFRDLSDNTDSSVTTVLGFGPPSPQVETTPTVPNASFWSLGMFAQGEFQVTSRAQLVLGLRGQDVEASTRTTPGLSGPLSSEAHSTVVGAANAIVEVTDDVSVIATLGRAFRSPNLVERFFAGPTPEGGSYQAPNPDLAPETSVNVDLGLRYRDSRLLVEGFVFRNEIRDGIRIAPTGNTVNGLPEYQNINVEKLRYTGIEASADAALPAGFSVGANFTHLASRDVLDPDNPVGDTFSSRVTGYVRYTDPTSRFWVAWSARHNGERKDVDLGSAPLGSVLPAFTVYNAQAGVTVIRSPRHSQRLGIRVNNLTNVLYAEFANASFFRPEPGRGVTVTWNINF